MKNWAPLPSQRWSTAYDDWCIAQVAQKLGRTRYL